MWRYLVGGVAAILMMAAALIVLRPSAKADVPALLRSAPAASDADDPLPDTVPEASARTREQKRFDRYDKDRSGQISRDEYLAQRRKTFARLDTDHDGRLSFDEWAIKNETKFATADKDRSGTMTPAEFATTAVKRKTPAHAKCPPAATPAGEDG